MGARAGRRRERPRGGIGGEQPGHLGLGYAGGAPLPQAAEQEGPLGLRREQGAVGQGRPAPPAPGRGTRAHSISLVLVPAFSPSCQESKYSHF